MDFVGGHLLWDEHNTYAWIKGLCNSRNCASISSWHVGIFFYCIILTKISSVCLFCVHLGQCKVGWGKGGARVERRTCHVLHESHWRWTIDLMDLINFTSRFLLRAVLVTRCIVFIGVSSPAWVWAHLYWGARTEASERWAGRELLSDQTSSQRQRGQSPGGRGRKVEASEAGTGSAGHSGHRTRPPVHASDLGGHGVRRASQSMLWYYYSKWTFNWKSGGIVFEILIHDLADRSRSMSIQKRGEDFSIEAEVKL